jgi:hypothetical protein
MKLSTSRKMFGIALMALLIVVSASMDAMGQGRGRRARDRFDRSDRFDRKCDKFVNCHDARDGRWDGRGPRRDRDDDFRDRFRRNRRFRDRDRDRDFDTRWRRRRQRDRDFDRFWWR